MFNMLKGYWQVPLIQPSREISAFIAPSGLYQYKVMPFGIQKCSSNIPKMVDKLVRDTDGCKRYIDDVVIYYAIAIIGQIMPIRVNISFK